MLVATLSVLILIVELSCARTTVYFDSKPGTAPVLRVSLAGAQHLVDQALVGTPPARATHAAPPTAASRSQLLQLRSELDAAQAVAASDLDTPVKLEALRGRVTEAERTANALVAQRTPFVAAGYFPDLVPVDRATLQQLSAQLDLAARLASAF